MKHYAFAFLIIGTMALGCDKDKDDDDDSGKTKTELITQSSWKYEAAWLGTVGVPLPAGIISDCEKDNVLTLNSNGTGTVDEGTTKCNSGDPQTNNITWSFKENETVLSTPTEIAPGVSGDIKINTLTATKLQVQKAVPTPFGTQTIIIDLKH